MYKIVGDDGKEYGPVSVADIKQWLIEGRLTPNTMVMPAGGTRWQKLSEIPELSSAAGPSPRAAEMANGPAIGLIVTAILGFCLQVTSILGNMFGMTRLPVNNAPPGFNPEAFRFFTGSFGIVLNIVGVAVGVVILLGALKMKKLESREWAMTASILAMIPCISPCCIVGLPIGIWSLIVLSKPEMKNAFR